MLTRVEDVSEYCSECLVCVPEALEACPDCGSEDLHPLELCPHAYLGYLLDGRYLLDRYIGGGASGEVYRATDRKLSRPFALKIVELGGYEMDEEEREEKVRRFENEVQALSRLRNPHVINIFESFELGDENSALLTQYIDGVTLEELMREGPMPIGRALTVVRQVANGLHEAHEQGVVHRDVKPGNIMIEELPAAGIFARVLDFGLVHLVDDASHTRGFRGTPLYAAPEQCTSKLEVDRRADIYGLAAVTFHALAGRPPFGGDSAVSIIESHCHDPAPKLSEVEGRTFPDELVELVGRAMQKEPEDRPDTLRAFVQVLDSIVGEQSGTVGRDPEEGLEENAGTVVEEEGEASEAAVAETNAKIGTISTVQSGEIPAELLQSVELSEYLGSFAGGATVVRFDRAGRCILLADGRNRVHVVSRGDRMYNDSFEGATMRLTGVAAQVARGGVFASEMNGRILRWRIDGGGEAPGTVAQFTERVLALDVDPHGTRLVVGSERGNVSSYDARTGRTRSHCQLDHPVCSVRAVPGEQKLVAATMTGDVELIEYDDGDVERSRVLEVGTEPGAVALDERACWCAVLDREGRLEVIHMYEPSRSFSVEPVPSRLRSVSFSPNGQLLGITIDEGTLRIWVFHHEPLERRNALQG